MAGLFYKDWLCFLRNDLKGLVFAVVVLMFASSNSTAQIRFLTFSAVLPMLFLWLGLDTLICDDKSGWDMYARSLPLTAKRIVLEKYLLTFGLFAAGTALAFALSAVLGVRGEGSGLQLFFFAGIPFLASAALFPLFYRTNAHVAVTAVMFSCLAILLLLMVFFMKNAAVLEALAANPIVPVLKRLSVPAGLLLLAGSYAASLRTYGKYDAAVNKA